MFQPVKPLSPASFLPRLFRSFPFPTQRREQFTLWYTDTSTTFFGKLDLSKEGQGEAPLLRLAFRAVAAANSRLNRAPFGFRPRLLPAMFALMLPDRRVYNNERMNNNHPSAQPHSSHSCPANALVLLRKTAASLSKGPAPHPRDTIHLFYVNGKCRLTDKGAQAENAEKIKIFFRRVFRSWEVAALCAEFTFRS